jgi:hypothetical protein
MPLFRNGWEGVDKNEPVARRPAWERVERKDQTVWKAVCIPCCFFMANYRPSRGRRTRMKRSSYSPRGIIAPGIFFILRRKGEESYDTTGEGWTRRDYR